VKKFMPIQDPIPFISNDAFMEIFQSMTEGFIMVDEDGKILMSNHVVQQTFGYGSSEMMNLSLETLLPERFRIGHVHFRRGFTEHPKPRRMGIGRDLMALHKNGHEFPVEISLSFTRYKDNLLVMAFIIDITLRKKDQEALKRSEEQLIVYAAELENKVQLRTEALHNMVAELEKEVQERKKAEEETKKALEKERELNELKSKFVSLASHEFRTPLSTIMSSVSLIGQYKEKGELDKVDKHIYRIKSSVGHLTNILNDFLSLGKLEEGKVEYKPEDIDLTDFLKEIGEELKASLKAGQHIVTECSLGDTTIFTDGHILRNVLFNLLSNASKYSADHKNIYLRCQSDPDEISFSVTDVGIGIPEHDRKHIFERFFRATNASNIQGTGLGLNIVKRYAELLGGRVSFTSEYGKGSTFTIVIPKE
jgi:PAS domain S-box-containing protein